MIKNTTLTLLIATALLGGCASMGERDKAMEQAYEQRAYLGASALYSDSDIALILTPHEHVVWGREPMRKAQPFLWVEQAFPIEAMVREAIQFPVAAPEASIAAPASSLIVQSQTVHFKSGSPRLSEDEKKRINGLTIKPTSEIELVGHTDNVGTDAYNMHLAQDRTESVKNQLIARGVKQERIDGRAEGKRTPLADNKTAAERAMNRRVEIVIEEVK